MESIATAPRYRAANPEERDRHARWMTPLRGRHRERQRCGIQAATVLVIMGEHCFPGVVWWIVPARTLSSLRSTTSSRAASTSSTRRTGSPGSAKCRTAIAPESSSVTTERSQGRARMQLSSSSSRPPGCGGRGSRTPRPQHRHPSPPVLVQANAMNVRGTIIPGARRLTRRAAFHSPPAAMTQDTCADLFDDDLDAGPKALGDAEFATVPLKVSSTTSRRSQIRASAPRTSLSRCPSGRAGARQVPSSCSAV